MILVFLFQEQELIWGLVLGVNVDRMILFGLEIVGTLQILIDIPHGSSASDRLSQRHR